LVRCSWAGTDPLYVNYHDTEWGVEVRGDNAMFERLSLEGFQAGLSWITILKRREGFRAAFRGFEIDLVAALPESEVDALMLDTGIIRNRSKILSTIKNAGICQQLDLTELLWGFAPTADKVRVSEPRAVSPESTELSKALRKLGFGFVGPTTMHALMQAVGMFNEHDRACFRHSQLL
jgi:DNA-3-methyladenine glycosylase I